MFQAYLITYAGIVWVALLFAVWLGTRGKS
jgi:hypothetical protein